MKLNTLFKLNRGIWEANSPYLSGDILQQNDDRAGWHFPPAIFVAVAQRDARVLHCKNPVHSPGTPRRLNGYPGCSRITYSKPRSTSRRKSLKIGIYLAAIAWRLVPRSSTNNMVYIYTSFKCWQPSGKSFSPWLVKCVVHCAISLNYCQSILTDGS